MEIKLNNTTDKLIIDKRDYKKVSICNWFTYTKKRNKLKRYVKSTIKINGRQIPIHRYILGIIDPKVFVDHKNGNPLDNRRSNLRICSITDNNRNKSSHPGSTSKYLGVFFYKRTSRWVACIYYNGKTVFRRVFDTEEEAALQYNKQAIKYFGEFANLNKVPKIKGI